MQVHQYKWKQKSNKKVITKYAPSLNLSSIKLILELTLSTIPMINIIFMSLHTICPQWSQNLIQSYTLVRKSSHWKSTFSYENYQGKLSRSKCF